MQKNLKNQSVNFQRTKINPKYKFIEISKEIKKQLL